MKRLMSERARRLMQLGLGVTLGAMAPFAAALSQSNLSTQGFGFPTGQFSTRAQGTGGSIAEMDPLTPINPATIALVGRILFFQIEPEYRTVKTAKGSEGTTTARYPVVFGALPVGSNWTVSLGSSTLLDRTSSSIFKTTQFLKNGDSVPTTTTFGIDGAMNDVRLATAWAPTTWLHVGVGIHGIAGHNLITINQAFADSSQFSSFTLQRVLSFSGSAVSAGADFVNKNFVASVSARRGGSLTLSAEDTTLTSARVPNRYGGSFAYTGLAGSTFSVRTSHDAWSSLGSLGTTGLRSVDSWDSSIGADVAGPRWANRIIYLRAGARMRTLPFLASGDTVSEKSVSAGLGTTFANGHVLGDIAIVRASRTANVGASEHATTLSIGLSVRP